MMVGMKGGAVCAVPDVSSTAKAYSFHEKIRQKIAVEAMPVAAWGSTTLYEGLATVYSRRSAPPLHIRAGSRR